MSRSEPFSDERQPILFDDLPLPPPVFSDVRAKEDMLHMVLTLERAKEPPWSLRLLEWQKRKFALLAQKLTPVDAAELTARFEAEVERWGPAPDFWAADEE